MENFIRFLPPPSHVHLGAYFAEKHILRYLIEKKNLHFILPGIREDKVRIIEKVAGVFVSFRSNIFCVPSSPCRRGRCEEEGRARYYFPLPDLAYKRFLNPFSSQIRVSSCFKTWSPSKMALQPKPTKKSFQ